MRRNAIITLMCMFMFMFMLSLLLSACGSSSGADNAAADGRPDPVPSLLRKMVPTSRWMPAGWSFRQAMASDMSSEVTEDVCGITGFGDDVKIINGASGYYTGDGDRSLIITLAVHTNDGAAVVDTFTTQATCDEWQINDTTTMRFSPAPVRDLADGGWARAFAYDERGAPFEGQVAILRIGDVVVRSVVISWWQLSDETAALWNTMLDHAISVATTGEPLPSPRLP